MLITYSIVDISHFSGLGKLYSSRLLCWLLDNACFAFALTVLVSESVFLF